MSFFGKRVTKQTGRDVSGGEKTHGKLWKTIGIVVCVLLIGSGFVVERWGGNGFVPSWQQLYHMVGVAPDGPEATLLQENNTAVSFLNVGQGDAVLIVQDGEACLIDAGTADASDALVGQLRAAGVKKLKLLIMTHPHADHIGGMKAVLENFAVEQLLLPDLTLPDCASATLDHVLTAAKQQAVSIHTAQAGESYALGAGMVTVLCTGVRIDEKSTDDAVNDTSLCIRFAAGNFSFLDTGDAEAEEEAALVGMATEQPLHSTLFKAGHHGSSTSSTQILLDAVYPKAICISCGLNNDFGHPHRQTLERYEAMGASVFRTDLDGSVTFVPTENGLAVSTSDNGTALLPAA